MSGRVPSFKDLRPASSRASAAAKGASRKSDTRQERLLRSELWRSGLRFRKNVGTLPGKPDIVFTRLKVAIFCDGDFWHGRAWSSRKEKLEKGTNAEYWINKIERNIERDRKSTELLKGLGWTVMRFWETDILRDPKATAQRIKDELKKLEAFFSEKWNEEIPSPAASGSRSNN